MSKGKRKQERAERAKKHTEHLRKESKKKLQAPGKKKK